MPDAPQSDMHPRRTPLVRSGRFLGALLVASFGSTALGDAGTALPAQQPQPPACDVWTADYALAGRLRLDDTPFGAGNGVYTVGPGHLRLRFSRTPDPGALKVELLAYEMRERFVVKSSVLFVHATVTTSADTRATPDEQG